MNILKIPIKNAFRHRLRTTLTVVGIAIAVLAFGILRTVVDAWYAGAEASSATRLVTRNSISLVFPLPLSYKERIRQVPGVELAAYGNWFGGIYIDEKNFFPSFAMDLEAYLKMYPEYIIPAAQKSVALRERKSCIVGRKLAERFGWKPGDPIVLKGTIFPGEWEFVLRAVYSGRDKNTDETQFFFHWDYLNEVMKKTAPSRADQVGFFTVEVKDRNQAAAVSKTIDATFKNSLAETLTETEKAFQMSFIAMTEAIVIAIQLVSFVVII
ncbi:MAG: ABC transporter permease, partial [Pseudomonadota bacterium]